MKVVDPPKLVKHTQLLRDWGEFQLADSFIPDLIEPPQEGQTPVVCADPPSPRSDQFSSNREILPDLLVRVVSEKTFICKLCGFVFGTRTDYTCHKNMKVGFGHESASWGVPPLWVANIMGAPVLVSRVSVPGLVWWTRLTHPSRW